MRAGIAAAIVAASIFGGGSAWAGCAPARRGHCINLNLVPQISQQIVASEHLPPPPQKTPVAAPPPAYTGPIVGLAKNIRRAPTVGYRWSLQ